MKAETPQCSVSTLYLDYNIAIVLDTKNKKLPLII